MPYLSPTELADAKLYSSMKEPTKFHKLAVIRFRLKLEGHSMRVIGDNEELLEKAFNHAKLYFI